MGKKRGKTEETHHRALTVKYTNGSSHISWFVHYMNFNLFKSPRVIPVGAWQASSEQKSHRTIEEEQITWKKICQNDKITIFIGCFELVTRQKIVCVCARARTSLAQPSIVTQNATNGRPICISTWTVTANTNSRTNTRVTPTIDLYDYYFSVVCLMHFFNFWFLTTKKITHTLTKLYNHSHFDTNERDG